MAQFFEATDLGSLHWFEKLRTIKCKVFNVQIFEDLSLHCCKELTRLKTGITESMSSQGNLPNIFYVVCFAFSASTFVSMSGTCRHEYVHYPLANRLRPLSQWGGVVHLSYTKSNHVLLYSELMVCHLICVVTAHTRLKWPHKLPMLSPLIMTRMKYIDENYSGLKSTMDSWQNYVAMC